MNEAKKVFNEISEIPKIVSHTELVSYPKDVDFYTPTKVMPLAQKILKNNDFVSIISSKTHSIYYKFIGGELYLFDLCNDYNFYFNFFKTIKLSDIGNYELGVNKDLNKSVKRFLENKKIEKNDIPKLVNFFSQDKNFISFPKNLSSKEDIYSSLKKLIGRSRLTEHINLRIKNLFKIKKRGRSFAFIGPDGSGKSFFINNLKKTKAVKIIYMGDWFFKLQHFYTFLMKIPSPFNRFVVLFYYLENLIRRFKVLSWTTIGKTVLIDRFPGTNSPIILSGVPGLINYLIFKFTPKPSFFVFLDADPVTVFNRKQELSVSQIKKIQLSQKKLISSYPHVIIDTEDLDNSLNYLLNKLYEA